MLLKVRIPGITVPWSNYNDTVSKFLIKYVVIFDFRTETSVKMAESNWKNISNQYRKITYMVPFIFVKVGEPPFIKESFFYVVFLYMSREPLT